MILRKLEIENAFAFGNKATLNFDKLDNHTQVIGYNYDEDPTGNASNGASKSSIFLCLQEVLFGKNLKNTIKDDIANYNINKGYKISVIFEENLDLYTVTVERNNNGKSFLTLLKNGIDISEHTVPKTYKKLHNIINLDYTLFTNFTYQSQSNYLNFLTIADSEKKKFLVKLFQLEKYTEDADYFKKLLNEKDKKVKLEKALLKRLKEDINSIVIFNKKKELEYSEDSSTKDLESTLHNTVKSISNIMETNNEINKHIHYKKELQDLEKSLEKCSVKTWTDQESKELKKLENEETLIKNELNSVKTKVRQYKKEEHKLCPTCGQKVPTSFNKDQLVLLENKEKRLEHNLKNTSTLLKCSRITFEGFRHFENLEESYSRILSSFEPKIALREILDLKELKDKQTLILSKLRKIEEVKTSIINENKKIHAFNVQQNTNAKLLLEKENKYKTDEQNYNINKKEQDTIIVLAEALKKLVTFKLESLLIHLQDCINKYIDILFSSDFALLISLKKEKLNFSILRGGKELPVVNLSTGEFNRLQIAILFAIREVLSSISSNNINILFLDEVLSSVDSLGREKIYELIDTLPFKVLSISHTFYDNKLPTIIIKKEKGIARIENAD